MFRSNKRVLWLLNHKTLTKFEVPLLLEFGLEVFTPKIMPAHVDFRTGAIDFAYDKSLSIPSSALKRLNQFDFYDAIWPADVVTIVNQYFGTVFTQPYGKQVSEVLDKFAGQIVFRAFGLPGRQTYKGLLEAMYGFDSLAKIYALGDRFWFGEGYEQLRECEPPLLADRALYLPIGVPKSFFKNANQWNPLIKKILFICPNVISNSYYSTIYRQFKKEFGDLPHVIVGAQNVKVNDSSMLGYVTEEELHRLYAECVVLYYHSTEPRHVHYSPIEAAVSGMPIVFFRNSLLGRLCEGATPGCVDSLDEARSIIKRVIDGDKELIDLLRKGQRQVSYKFSDDYCRRTWERSLVESGFRARLEKERPIRICAREALRAVLARVGKGFAFAQFRVRVPLIPYDKLRILGDDESYDRTLEEGINFTLPGYPKFVLGTNGISQHEFWGRWSVGKRISIFFDHPLPKKFCLVITGGAYGPNLGVPFEVRIGNVSRCATFGKGIDNPDTSRLEFSLRTPSRVIEIIVPHPTVPELDLRAIGLGFVRLRILSDEFTQETVRRSCE
jgi:hypothetical protein